MSASRTPATQPAVLATHLARRQDDGHLVLTIHADLSAISQVVGTWVLRRMAAPR